VKQRQNSHSKKGRSIIIDRCNFDISQRHTWFKIAAKYKVTRLDALLLDIDPEICKKRISTRKNHPTIAEGSQEGPAIIDRFASIFVQPTVYEGFASVTVIKSSDELNGITENYRLSKVEEKMDDEGWETKKKGKKK